MTVALSESGIAMSDDVDTLSSTARLDATIAAGKISTCSGTPSFVPLVSNTSMETDRRDLRQQKNIERMR